VDQYEVELRLKIQELDTNDDEIGLNEVYRVERKALLAEQNKNNLKQETIVHQKARCSWLKQSDMNTRYFHSVTKWRRASNGLNGILVNDQWCEEPTLVKGKVKYFFLI